MSSSTGVPTPVVPHDYVQASMPWWLACVIILDATGFLASAITHSLLVAVPTLIVFALLVYLGSGWATAWRFRHGQMAAFRDGVQRWVQATYGLRLSPDESTVLATRRQAVTGELPRLNTVPADYDSAWLVRRVQGKQVRMSLHVPQEGPAGLHLPDGTPVASAAHTGVQA